MTNKAEKPKMEYKDLTFTDIILGYLKGRIKHNELEGKFYNMADRKPNSTLIKILFVPGTITAGLFMCAKSNKVTLGEKLCLASAWGTYELIKTGIYGTGIYLLYNNYFG